MSKRALIIGANGLVGSECLNQLLNDPRYSEVTILTRKYVALEHPKLVKHIIEFNNLHQSWDLFRGDEMYYAVGTTKSKAGSKANFRKIDLDYALNIAKIAQHNKVKQMILVSAMGADETSFFFYNRIKGLLEEELKTVGFQSLIFIRPALLLGAREENRFGESLAQAFFRVFNIIMIGPLRRLKAIKAKDVAQCMIHVANLDLENIHVFLNDDLHDIIDQYKTNSSPN